MLVIKASQSRTFCNDVDVNMRWQNGCSRLKGKLILKVIVVL